MPNIKYHKENLEELRKKTCEAFAKYRLRQVKAARDYGCTPVYIWKVLHGRVKNEKCLIWLSEWVLKQLDLLKKEDHATAHRVRQLAEAMTY